MKMFYLPESLVFDARVTKFQLIKSANNFPASQ